MKIIENNRGCSMCRRIPALSPEEVQRLQNGEFLHRLVEEDAQNTAKKTDNGSATDTMNSVLDNLEALFGFGDVPAGNPVPVQEQHPDNPVTEEDLGIDQIIYCHHEKFYLRGKRQDYAVQFCPFCGNHL